ncbi:hypothetical protein THIX_30265 [Thiomonas sp. X19]|uniref:hypothetical protein n=1 Tax=Thiomonas sp. X19 TaxID=1050370 RepID=UPI000B6C2B9A|nr:hypothetical protein [Thiomonas sp. X19]SCC93037.1 hypothetical protein THIX_30265 [Thiomonas sp. X19]
MAASQPPMPERSPAFTPYAQNFKGVILWRALGQVEQGFYIDVVAWSPDTSGSESWSMTTAVSGNPEKRRECARVRFRAQDVVR